ncbi:hypothetical protein DFQ01_1622 [Paenibacillus cellulosilyticus]|uniref:Addiction module component n=1 Tax=Paenibacillus cellulosilyticus TaxID=375489 RepID=A0A2V2YB97_9BACL|nr:hypothetical protein [Paenibacillus cellulosilyticus]PWV87366.1 hypothetical protein DFQ01_1622 [Paenibacillus cellulosilyticus]QKS44947.1 hypothetical protein HUB94_11385 [Paenibacillus cellulosilyticus]
MAINKKELSELINKLSDNDIPLVADLVKRLIHPADYHIPYDDEPLTQDDIEAVDEANQEFLEGKTIKFEDIKHELQN